MKKFYLLILMAILSFSLFGQTHWTKYPDNPVMIPGSAGEWDDDGISAANILFYDNKYHMWYSSGDFFTNEVCVGYATSDDGITWSKHDGNPVLSAGPTGSWDENHVIYPCVLIKDEIYHMWYTGQSGDNFSDNYKIGHATSLDGINWTKDPNNPVLDAGPDGTWDGAWIANGPVVYTDTVFHIWYSGCNGVDDNLLTGHATSPDGINWTKDLQNPVLTAGEWDSPRCFPGPVIFDGFKYHMWYGGGEYLGWKCGYASSEDGSHWTKYPDNPVLDVGPTGLWDDKYLMATSVLFEPSEDKYRMWYTGNGEGGKESVGVAETYEPAWKLVNNQHIGGMTVVSDSLIYTFAGGGEDWVIGNKTRCYNTVTNKWSELRNMPLAMRNGGIGQIGDKIYLVGGWINESPDNWITTDAIQEYDITNDSWTYKTKCPIKIGSCVSSVKDGKIYLFGGMGSVVDKSLIYQAWIYDPVNEVWDKTSLPDMQYPHLMHGTAEVLDGNIYVLGGAAPPVDMDFSIVRSEKFDGVSWEPIAEMPLPVVEHKSMVYNNKILVFGGDSVWSIDKSYSINLIQEYDPDSDSWRLMEPMPFQRSNMEGGKAGNYVYLMGGYLDDREPETMVSEVWRFNLDSLEVWPDVCTDVIIMEHKDSLEVGEKDTISARVLPDYTPDKTVLWSSDNPDVADVSTEGVVSGVANGTATISATANTGGCTDSYVVDIFIVGIQKTSRENISIYPNPAHDLISIHMNTKVAHQVEISSLSGQVVYSAMMNDPEYQIDLSSFEKGIYFVTVRSKEFVRTEKVVKL